MTARPNSGPGNVARSAIITFFQNESGKSAIITAKQNQGKLTNYIDSYIDRTPYEEYETGVYASYPPTSDLHLIVYITSSAGTSTSRYTLRAGRGSMAFGASSEEPVDVSCEGSPAEDNNYYYIYR